MLKVIVLSIVSYKDVTSFINLYCNKSKLTHDLSLYYSNNALSFSFQPIRSVPVEVLVITMTGVWTPPLTLVEIGLL